MTGSPNLPISPSSEVNKLISVNRVFLVAGFYPDNLRAPKISTWLRRNAAADRVIGGLPNDVFVLAHCGLLDNYDATVHWEDFSRFCALYAEVNARYQRFFTDRNRLSASDLAGKVGLSRRALLPAFRTETGQRSLKCNVQPRNNNSILSS
jgi:transcriptional regulator GlxA family with amidase domain